jgi:lipopolysaccharide/colanic/teichoic acid biosynthesis glycosyltransferase
VVPVGRQESDFLGAAARKRAFDLVLASVLLVMLMPLVIVIAIAIKLDSRGPVLYRCRRAGRHGVEFAMLKFRKMHDGAGGLALTAPDDARFTRVGNVLARTKLDEIPQLFNVLRGEMSLVGPRPEDPYFVGLAAAKYVTVLKVRPGITGLSQVAFARESEILYATDRVGHYVRAIFPQKLALDVLYATKRSIRMDLLILGWTALAVLARREVAVNRLSGTLTRRDRSRTRQPIVEASQT